MASGGHTLLAGAHDHSAFETLGATLDDAAGEAFDKGRGCSGWAIPGGPAIERAARDGDPEAFEFPVAMSERGLDFSYSGIKTALVYLVRDLGPSGPSAGAPTSPPPTSARSSLSWSRSAWQQALDQTGDWRAGAWAAEWPPTPS